MLRPKLSTGIALAAVIAVLGVTSIALARTQAATATTVTVKATEFKFRLSTTRAHHGVFIFKVTNRGKIAHDFKIAGKKTVKLRPGLVALGLDVAKVDDAVRFVRRLGSRVLLERGAHLGADHHQRSASISRSTSAASQKEAERYFQPASARIATTTPSSSSAASLRATWTTAPAETPAKRPSRSSRARTPATASAFETSSFRSGFETSRIGGT